MAMPDRDAIPARFELSDTAFDIAPLRARLLDDRAGAYASFEGWVRDHNDGRPVHGLRYEAYATLATAEGQRIVEEAAARHGLHWPRERLRVAVDGAFAHWHDGVRDGSEVAFIPPVSGG
jgi:molybdopterin synthase catalytic subunit